MRARQPVPRIRQAEGIESPVPARAYQDRAHRERAVDFREDIDFRRAVVAGNARENAYVVVERLLKVDALAALQTRPRL